MKKGITIGIMAVFVVIVGGLSMGCIDAPVEVPEDNGGLTAKGLQVKADVEEREARGFVQYTGKFVQYGVIQPIIVEEVEEVENKVKLELPYIGPLAYPENLDGFDSVEARLILCEDALNIQLEALDTLTVSQYLTPSTHPYTEFYTGLWQSRLNDYAKMYNLVGNTVMTDEDDYERTLKIAAFNFTSPWGVRNLGNGSFVYDIQTEKVSFVGNETASGNLIAVNASGAVIDGMFYTYMGNNATLTGETEVTF